MHPLAEGRTPRRAIPSYAAIEFLRDAYQIDDVTFFISLESRLQGF